MKKSICQKIFNLIFICLLASLTEVYAQQTPIDNGLSYLRSSQSADGSWGGTASSRVDIVPSAASVVETLRLLETAPTSQQALGRGYLAGLTLEETDFIARRIAALAGTSSKRFNHVMNGCIILQL
jgi:hypothetical protein